VDDGFPELFTVQGLSVSPVSLSRRYLDFAFSIRRLLLTPGPAEVREGLAETLALRVLWEVLMRLRAWDYAAYTFLHGTVGRSLAVDVGEIAASPDRLPRDEGHMASLYFGLLHELGHAAPPQLTDQFGPSDYLSDDAIVEWIETVIQQSEIADELDVPTITTDATTLAGHPLNVDLLRSEIRADLFAVTALVRATHRVMAASGERFELGRFIAEPTLFVAPLWFLTVCRRLAAHLARKGSTDDQIRSMLLHPASLAVRLNYIHNYMSVWSAVWEGQPDRWEENRARFDATTIELSEPLGQLEAGLSRVIRFVLFPHERPPAHELLQRFVLEADADEWIRTEAARFSRLADVTNAPTGSGPLEVIRGLAAR
jgi:hypothetical protein